MPESYRWWTVTLWRDDCGIGVKLGPLTLAVFDAEGRWWPYVSWMTRPVWDPMMAWIRRGES